MALSRLLLSAHRRLRRKTRMLSDHRVGHTYMASGY